MWAYFTLILTLPKGVISQNLQLCHNVACNCLTLQSTCSGMYFQWDDTPPALLHPHLMPQEMWVCFPLYFPPTPGMFIPATWLVAQTISTLFLVECTPLHVTSITGGVSVCSSQCVGCICFWDDPIVFPSCRQAGSTQIFTVSTIPAILYTFLVSGSFSMNASHSMFIPFPCLQILFPWLIFTCSQVVSKSNILSSNSLQSG